MNSIIVRSFLLHSLSLLLVASVVAPSMIKYANLKTVILEPEDFSAEETPTSEYEGFEKDIVLQKIDRQRLFLPGPSAVLIENRHGYLVRPTTDIFLPPPEHK